MPGRLAAVITGDLIGSSDAGAGVVEQAMAILAETAGELTGRMAAGNTHFTRFRGDGWQVHIADASLALRAALILLARLRGTGMPIATRAAIGIGTVDYLGTATLADARGTAFEFSGHALDKLRRTSRLAIAGQDINALHRAIIDLLDARARRWTAQQAEALALALHRGNPTLAEIGTQLGISAQAVNYRLSGADARVIRRTLDDWEDDFEFNVLSGKGKV